MKKRDIKILNEIINGQEETSIAKLAMKYQVSERTVRNDLKTIDEILKLNQLPLLNLHSNGIINYPGDRNLVLNLIQSNDFYNYKLSKEEREIAICLNLLIATGYVTVSVFSQELFVSRATLISDLESVKEFFQFHGLQVDSHPNKGILLLGTERDRRRCLLHIIFSRIGLLEVSFDPYNPFYNMILDRIDRDENKKRFIEQIIKTEEQKNNLYFSDSSFFSLSYYLLIAMERMKEGQYVQTDPREHNEKYPLAKEILKYITDYYKLPLKEGEIESFSEILMSLGLVHGESSNRNIVEIQMVVTEFIRRISESLRNDLTSDFIFYESLLKHVQTMFNNNFAVIPQNTVQDILNKSYPDEMNITQQEVAILENFMGHPIDKNKVSYIAMHVCAAIERKKNNMKPAKIIMVCNGGVGTSKLLIERLKKRFNFEVLTVVAAHNVDTLKNNQADLIISTVPLKNFTGNYLIVSPLLNDGDYLKICKSLESIPDHKEQQEAGKFHFQNFVNVITPLVDECITHQEDKARLEKKLYPAILEYFEEQLTNVLYLHQLLTPDKIKLEVSSDNCRDAIKKAADVLLQQNYIEPCYIDAILQNMEDNGPYFVLSKGFALPHAGINSGTQKMGMSLIRLEQPVYFGNQELDPVEFVCCLSAVDCDSHLKAFFNLVNLLRWEDFKMQLRVAKSPQEAASVIGKYEFLLNISKRKSGCKP